ncbi:MAG: acyl carrier protein [Alphaproteobacteria bacterium]|nr:acyl carrier protein [Alphaproteobacteria bacterium]
MRSDAAIKVAAVSPAIRSRVKTMGEVRLDDDKIARMDFWAPTPDNYRVIRNDAEKKSSFGGAGWVASPRICRLFGKYRTTAMPKSQITANDIAARTIDLIASRSGMEAVKITRDTKLDEFGISSLELTEIVMDLEDLFDIDIDLNAAEAWETLNNVGNIVDVIDKLVSARS